MHLGLTIGVVVDVDKEDLAVCEVSVATGDVDAVE
jgi:hypothetical protein